MPKSALRDLMSKSALKCPKVSKIAQIVQKSKKMSDKNVHRIIEMGSEGLQNCAQMFSVDMVRIEEVCVGLNRRRHPT